MRTKILKKVISIMCAAVMATSCAVVPVGAAPNSDDGGSVQSSLRRSYAEGDLYNIGVRDFSVSLQRDMFLENAVHFRRELERVAEIQRRAEELVDRAERLANNGSLGEIRRLEEDLVSFVEIVNNMDPFFAGGLVSPEGDHFLTQVILVANRIGFVEGEDVEYARYYARRVAESTREVIAECQVIANAYYVNINKMELAALATEISKGKKDGKKPTPTPIPTPIPTPTPTPPTPPTPPALPTLPTPPTVPASNEYDRDEYLAVELQLNEFGKSIKQYPSYEAAKEAAAHYQMLIADQGGFDLSPDLGDSQNNAPANSNNDDARLPDVNGTSNPNNQFLPGDSSNNNSGNNNNNVRNVVSNLMTKVTGFEAKSVEIGNAIVGVQDLSGVEKVSSDIGKLSREALGISDEVNRLMTNEAQYGAEERNLISNMYDKYHAVRKNIDGLNAKLDKKIEELRQSMLRVNNNM